MACTTLTQILKTCDNNIGGIETIWLWDMEDKLSTASTFDAATWSWTTYDITALGGTAPIQYQFIRNSSNFTEDGNIDLANGSSFNTLTVNLIIARREAAKSKSIKILGEGQRYLGALILDNNGLYWLVENLQLSATGDGSGTAKGDGSKYSLTLIAENSNLVGVVDTADAILLTTLGVYT